MNEQEQKLNAPPKKLGLPANPQKFLDQKLPPKTTSSPGRFFLALEVRRERPFPFPASPPKSGKSAKGTRLPPKKSYAEFSRLKNFQRALKFGCTLFAELLGWDRRALPWIIWLVLKTLTYTKPPKKINAKLSYPQKFRSRKFQTPKNPGLRSFPSLEIRTTAPPGQVKFG